MATDFRADLAAKTQPAVMADRVKRTKAIYGSAIGKWIDKYKGGMPAGFAAASIQWESDGIATTVGDPALGEYGYYQVTSEFPTTIGMASSSRMDPETNVFLGLMDYQLATARLAAASPFVQLGTADAWKLARLSFAIGAGGTQSLVKAATAWKVPAYGKVYDVVRAYVDAGGATAAGSQSADLVWYRVHTVDVVWDIGAAAAPFQTVGSPTIVPNPPTGKYVLPASLASYFRAPISGVIALAMGAGAYLLYRAIA
jgi:hypothetical protein